MIIINADDFGFSKGVNEAIVSCFDSGIISSASVMTNMDSFEDAVGYIVERDLKNKVGFHFNITQGMPLSEPIKRCKRFCDSSGNFIYKRNLALILSCKEISAISIEFETQLLKLLKAGIVPTHVDSHHHVHTEFFVLLSILKILKKYHINRVRIPRTSNSNFLYYAYKKMYVGVLHFNKIKTTRYFDAFTTHLACPSDYKKDSFTELMCHPIYREGRIVDATTGYNLFVKYSSTVSYSDL